MADMIPLKGIYDTGDSVALGEFNPGDTVGVLFGGTGANNPTQALINLGAASAATVSGISGTLSSHIGDTSIHFVINDSGLAANEAWSSNKITGELSLKSDVGHTHDDRYYTETEIDAFLNALTLDMVSVSSDDTIPGYLEDKIVGGQGITTSVSNPGGNEDLVINAQVYIATIGGNVCPVYVDSSKGGKVLSVATHTYQWDETSLSDDDWIQIGSATDTNSGHIVPYNGTIVGATYQCEDDNGNTKELDLYINGSLNGTLFTTNGSNGDQYGIDNSLNINVNAGDKLRMRAGTTGGNINDTIVVLYIKWRV
jgi:hypothetical protein